LFWGARVATSIAFQMQAVAIGWQAYALTGSAFYLGLVGLAQFLPMFLLTLVVGQVTDRYDRRHVARTCQLVEAMAAGTLAVGSAGAWLDRESLLVVVCVVGAARAFEGPSLQALVPGLVPSPLLPRAVAWATSANQTATILGPALGGLLYAAGPTTVYTTVGALFLGASLLMAGIRMERVSPTLEPLSVQSLFAGIAFIRRQRAILGAISLDLFAVLLGGATALLPIYARDLLHTGPWGLGLLRAAPAFGALSMSVILAHYPLRRRVGRTMFSAVAVFGFATIVFAVSTSFALSMGALVVLGAADVVSVVIRNSLVQLDTPDAMRGRVTAVHSLFIGTSNQLGEFESGVTAALFGTVPAVLLGGVGTILVSLLWLRLFPELARVDSLEDRTYTPADFAFLDSRLPIASDSEIR
jgi:MFS family permease